MTERRQQKRIPKDFAAKLEAARARRTMRGERRIITALFCDVVGSTAMAEQLDPEEWGEIMDDAFDFLIAPIYRYEGTVARLMGDAILAFFGAPIAHEDDPERAILAGLEMVADIQPFRDLIQRDYALDFNVRVGINTGPVVVGEVGSDLALEYTAMGDAVNLAARMEQTAAPGTVQVSSHTYKLVAPLFDFELLGKIDLKGKSEPVTVYRPLGRKQVPGRLRGIEGISAPLIGRAQEIERLRKMVAEVRRGRGQIACLIGEAGLGKSRLIQELQADWPDEASWTEMHGVSYNTTSPYGMFLQLLRQACFIDEYDSPEVVRQKLSAMMEEGQPEWTEEAIYAIEMLMAVAEAEDITSRSNGKRIEGEALKRELHEALLKMWQYGASNGPTVMVFDDLHWGDEASVELLLHLCQMVGDLPVMFLCAFRPYRNSPAWQLKRTLASRYPERYTEIVLNPLSDEDSDVLVGSLLAIADLPNQLRQLILQKTEGNPFFIEEVVRTLIDSGAVIRDQSGLHWRVETKVDEIALPDNVQALLIARIDRLEKEIRRTLQLAAVIGRSFYHRVLKTISDVATTLDEQLETLQRVELIYEAARLPELEYMFRHELTRDAAYKSILRRHRRQFHRRVGQALEALFPDRLEEESPRLAYHFYEAGDSERALKYHTMAADAAAGIYANAEAVVHYTHALEVARRVPVSNEQLIYLYTSRGRTLEVSGKYDSALANYEELETLARERADSTLELAALIPRATIYSTATVKQDLEQGQALSERALALSQEVKDLRAEAKVLWNMMLLEVSAGRDNRRSVAYGERSIAIARQQNLREELAYALHDIAFPYHTIGQFQQALAAREEAQELWRELGNLPMLADNLVSAAAGYFVLGDFDKTLSLSQEALKISQSIGSLWGQAYSFFTMGPVYLERGQMERGIKALQDGLPLAEQANFTAPQVMNPARLAWIYGYLGDIERGFEMAHFALAKSDQFGLIRGFVLVALARLHLYDGNLAKATTALEEAQSALDTDDINEILFSLFVQAASEIALASREYDRVLGLTENVITSMRNFGIRLFLYDMLHLRGRALFGLGRTAEASSILAEAQTEAEELGSRRSLLHILPSRIEVEVQIGNMGEVETLRKQVLEIIGFIDNHIGQPQLRASFRELPTVLAMLMEGQ
jgi:predicted ATPase/class 3 adenylate cyclase